MNNKKGFWRGALCGALAMLLVAGLVSCGLKENKETYDNNVSSVLPDQAEQKLGILDQLIQKYYLHEVDEESLQENVYAGYIKGLEDPYSTYYDEEATKKLSEDNQGAYDGIGATMSQDKETGIITITQVYENSPAEKAGLQGGDILYKVSGEEVTGQDLTEVVSRVRGEKGTSVDLTVVRGEDREIIDVTAVRDTMEYTTVITKMLDDQIGYLRITAFDAVTYDQYMAGYQALEAQGVQALVVDLRNNLGGNYDIVCKILDQILPEGRIVYMEDKNGQQEEMTSDEEHQIHIPMTVLVNQYSASASEIFAGAIQDYSMGEIVGVQTYGKGVVQRIFDLKDGTCVKLTIAKYYTAKGQDIDGKGITPDVVVEYENNEEDPSADNQLDRALEILQSKM